MKKLNHNDAEFAVLGVGLACFPGAIRSVVMHAVNEPTGWREVVVYLGWTLCVIVYVAIRRTYP